MCIRDRLSNGSLKAGGNIYMGKLLKRGILLLFCMALAACCVSCRDGSGSTSASSHNTLDAQSTMNTAQSTTAAATGTDYLSLIHI